MGCAILTQKVYLHTTLFCGLFVSKISLEGKKACLISYHLEQLVASAANMKISNFKAGLVLEYSKN